MRESDVGTSADVPRPWLIAVQAMTVEKARQIGRVLGSHGVHGQFLGGSLAENMCRYAQWRDEQRKGGEVNGEG